MKKIAISLLALAALSTASLASNRDVTTPFGAVDHQGADVVTTTDALIVPNSDRNSSYNGTEE